MINLLPPDTKESYRFAHRNVRLVRWVAAFGVAIAGLAVISAAGVFYLSQISHSYDQEITDLNKSLKAQNLVQTEQQTNEISNNLKLAVDVLSKQVLFSELLNQLAATIPNNVNLTDLDISQEQTGIDITAETTDYQSATQLQVNLADPANKLFSKADIVSINCISETEEGEETKYPCKVTIRALFVKDNPFLFINNSEAS